jgi:Uma2 family endonuclease
MNQHVRHPGTSQVADGLPRRRWSASDIARMLDAGIIQSGDPFELVGGELVAMAAKGARHERIKIALVMDWARRAGPAVMVAPESVLRLGANDEPEPDIFLYPSNQAPESIRGDTVLLVVEVADTTLAYDLGLKARLYASFGVRDYWVIDTRAATIRVHRQPTQDGFTSIEDVPSAAVATPLLLPDLAVRLSDLGLTPEI